MSAPDSGLTPGQRQAEFLAALSSHLLGHSLTPVYVYPSGELVLVGGEGGQVAAGQLAAWMRSVGVIRLSAWLNPEGAGPKAGGYASVHAAGAVSLAGLRVPDLWGPVTGLEELLAGRDADPDDWHRRIPLTVDELEHFAAHGTLPGPEGSGS